MARRDVTSANADGGAAIAQPHLPVLLDEVIKALAPKDNELFVDGTFGAGGYASRILETAQCRLVALDRDPTAIARAEPLKARFGERLRVVHAPFGTMAEAVGDGQVDGIVLDLGVSSMQLDEAERGFSFMRDGPLDMRMSQSGPHAGQSAADLINTASAETIADILYQYGDERKSRAIARAIIARREEKPFSRTGELADLVARVLKMKSHEKHPATRTFQALRIAINDELGELERALDASITLLKPGGRLVIVTFHSLEDGIVKRFLKEESGRNPRGSRHAPVGNVQELVPRYELVNASGVTPRDEELARNPRARSARLRSAIRTTAP
jgi:16S rRNA (cytosine1402-N4)-methyltransferase